MKRYSTVDIRPRGESREKPCIGVIAATSLSQGGKPAELAPPASPHPGTNENQEPSLVARRLPSTKAPIQERARHPKCLQNGLANLQRTPL